MPKLQNRGFIVNPTQWRDSEIIIIITVCGGDDGSYLLPAEFIKKQSQYLLGSAAVIGLAKSFYLLQA